MPWCVMASCAMASISRPENTGRKRSATVAPIILTAIPSTVLHSRLQCRYRKARTSAITFFIRRPDRRLRFDRTRDAAPDALTPKCTDPEAAGILLNGNLGKRSQSRQPERNRLNPLVECFDSGAAGRGDAQCRGESRKPNFPGWLDVFTIFIFGTSLFVDSMNWIIANVAGSTKGRSDKLAYF